MELTRAIRFATLLHSYRAATGLTQEELAERAGLSTRAISDLERGVRGRPQRETLALLAQALALSTEQRAVFEAVGRGRPLPASVGEGSELTRQPLALPSGTVTLLCSEIVDSAHQWEQHPAAMQAALARHDTLLHTGITAHGGVVVAEGGEGERVLALFEHPHEALAAACAVQQALAIEPWPAAAGPLLVRLALHSGEAGIWDGRAYRGTTVNRATRLRAAAHGGQVLLSAATYELVRDDLPDDVSLRDLEEHRLTDLLRPERIYQLVLPAGPSDFPALTTLDAQRHNLPVQPTALIGRERDVQEVRARLLEPAARLVTLTGSGGVGKTRLALAVAAEVVDQYPDGVWLVELAALADPALVPATVAQVLGLGEEPGHALLATLTAYLKEKRLLLVLDNCEHLIVAVAALAGTLLRACPHLRLLATSREGLEVRGERRYRVPSLPAPDLAHLPALAQLAASTAVALFVARARERQPEFALGGPNARAVATICARLDGIPLAIELAAARVGSLAVEGIAARLDDRFQLLTGGARDVLPRQRTLRAAVDWSYDLLSDAEQRLLDRLSVFAGGWTLAAEAVCAGEGVEDRAVLDLLDGLVNKSLVQAQERGAEVRYGLLETLRAYGREHLSARGEEAAVRRAHATYVLSLAEEAAKHLRGPEQKLWLDRLEEEHDNLRAALAWAQERGAAVEGLRLTAALWRFWSTHGHLSEGRRWSELALAVPHDGVDMDTTPLRVGVLHGATMLAIEQADFANATVLVERGMALARAGADPQHLAHAFYAQGHLARLQGNYAHATALQEEALALVRQAADQQLMAEVLLNLANTRAEVGDHQRATPLYSESLTLFRAVGDARGEAEVLSNQALYSAVRGAYTQAVTMASESVTLLRELGEIGILAQALFAEGWAAAWGDKQARVHARACLEESLALRRERGDRRGIGTSLATLGMVALLDGDMDGAAELGEEGVALLQEGGDRGLQAMALPVIGQAALSRGQRDLGAARLAESLSLIMSTGTHLFLVWTLQGIVCVAAEQDDLERAARLDGAIDALARAAEFVLPPLDRAGYEQAMTMVRGRLGDDAFAATRATGQAMTLDEVVALALEVAAAG